MDDRPATYDDVAATPEGVRAELIDGELFLQAAPAADHQLVASLLGADLVRRFHHREPDDQGPGGWVIVAGVELWLGQPTPNTLVLVPDLAGWRRERWPRQRTTHGLTVPPDWVCEVLSPSTQRHDRLRKLDAYARGGVGFVWLVDPIERFVEVYARRDDAWARVASGEGDKVHALPPFEGAPLTLARWWPDDDEP